MSWKLIENDFKLATAFAVSLTNMEGGLTVKNKSLNWLRSCFDLPPVTYSPTNLYMG